MNWISQYFQSSSRRDRASVWRARAETRLDLIKRYLGDDGSGFYRDYDLRAGEWLQNVPRSLASFVPLWAGVATPDQAARVVEHLPAFEYDHGLVSCEEGWDDQTEHITLLGGRIHTGMFVPVYAPMAFMTKLHGSP